MIPTSAALVAWLFVCQLGAAPQEGADRFQLTASRSAFSGSVPALESVEGVLELSLEQAIQRGLDHNLGVLLARHRATAASGRRGQARSDALPQLSASVGQARRKINLAAFGLQPAAGGTSLVGPFDVFDARLSVTWKVVDPVTYGHRKAASAELEAADWSVEDAEDFLVLVVTDAYLRALAWETQVAAVEAQLATAQSLRDLAGSRNESGLAAGVEVLRAELRLARDRQRLIVARSDYAKQRLVLARTIGLPLGAAFELLERLDDSTTSELELEGAVERAWANRADLRAAEARVEVATRELGAARGERLPTLSLEADYGVLGNELERSEEVYELGARVSVPLFVSGRIKGGRLEAEAQLQAASAELADLRAEIFYEVSAVRLDLDAAREEIAVTRSAIELGRRQLVEARNRFTAGVTGNLEVVEAQEDVARAYEEWIASAFRYRLNRARMIRALGGGVERRSHSRRPESE